MNTQPRFPSLKTVAALVLGAVLCIELGVIVFQKLQRPPCDGKEGAELKTCWEHVVAESLKKGDISGAFNSLASLYESGPALGETCHSLTHEIGRTAYSFFSRGVEFEITSKTAYCSYGFYHGFMEELVSRRGDMKLARAFCSYVDGKLAKVSPDVTLQCYHGIGHGTVNNHDPRTWGKEQLLIDPALALCEEVATTEEELSRCATGVYNGLSIFYATGEYKLVLDRRDPLKICRAQKLKYQDACYVSMNTLLLQLVNYDLRKAALFLEDISDDDIARHTMINLASPLGTKNMAGFDHSEMLTVCRSLPSRLRLACIQGYAFGFLEHGEPEREYVKPIQFCESDKLTTEEQKACFEYIFTYLPKWYSREKVEAICTTVNAPWRALCEQQTKQ